ncbi:MAG: hypothetical protein R2911_11000 [Caldilineaceae bacterium]
MVPITSVHIVQTADRVVHRISARSAGAAALLPIWVGPAEGLQIMLSLRQILPRGRGPLR